jgi:hypothetical protein
MAKQTINIGSTANDGTGTTLRDGGDLINDNFNEIYNKLGGGVTLYSLTFPNATDTVVGRDTSDTLTNKTIDSASNTITISGAEATLSNIANSSLSNSSITFAGDSGSDSASLGETYTIAGGTSISTTATSNTVTINLGSINATTTTITNVPTPSAAGDPVNKAYADSISEGLHVHEQVHGLTDTPLATITGDTVTYDNGSSGVGATLTMNTALDLSTDIDNHVVSIGERIIVAGESTAAHNGIYVVTSTTVLTRATDFDTPTEMAGGDFIWVTHGDTYGDTGWVMSEAVTTVGTSDVTFVQFSGAGSITAGNGIQKSGSTLSIDIDGATDLTASSLVGTDQIFLSDGGTEGRVAISQLDTLFKGTAQTLTNKTIALGSNTISGTKAQFNTAMTDADFATLTGTETLTGKTIAAGSNTISGLTNSNLSGSAGITTANLANSTITMAADSGTADPVSLGETFTIDGGQSITTTVSANQVSIAVTAGSISSTQLASASTLLIKDSAGTTLKTVIGAGV